MRNVFLAIVVVGCLASLASAQGLAQQKAEAQASLGGKAFHPAGWLGGATFEGVGMGSSRDEALAQCCNNGGRVIQMGVAQSPKNGMFYACKIYVGGASRATGNAGRSGVQRRSRLFR
jgi:hypothetical protein